MYKCAPGGYKEKRGRRMNKNKFCFEILEHNLVLYIQFFYFLIKKLKTKNQEKTQAREAGRSKTDLHSASAAPNPSPSLIPTSAAEYILQLLFLTLPIYTHIYITQIFPSKLPSPNSLFYPRPQLKLALPETSQSKNQVS